MKNIFIFLESCYFTAPVPILWIKKERVLILYTLRAVSKDFSFLLPILDSAIVELLKI
jgi:hypothetical protein